MTFDEAMQFWLGRINFEQRPPLPGDLKLDRIRNLLQLLGNPHCLYPIVHIAGTKGKGSTAAMLASILRQAGYRTGLFTSPHLEHLEERVQVDGQSISQEELRILLEDIRDISTRHSPAFAAALTFFEIGTAIGFLHFARRRCQAAVIEVGLGGRFDSTNVCDPRVTIITSISYDHTQMLGNTLTKIAFEKAGILKRGRSAVSGACDPEASVEITRVAREVGAPLRQLGVDIQYESDPAQITDAFQRPGHVQVTTERKAWPPMTLGLVGAHQAANAALAVAAVEHLREQGLTISDTAVAAGLENVDWPARMELLRKKPLVVLDCAHNTASAQALIDALEASFPLTPGGRRLLIFASSRDKDVGGMLHLLWPHFASIYLTRYTNNPRAVLPDKMLELMPDTGKDRCLVVADAPTAYRDALRVARPEDQICITGSVFLAGELRPVIRDGPH